MKFSSLLLSAVLNRVLLICEPASHASHHASHASHASQGASHASHGFNVRKNTKKYEIANKITLYFTTHMMRV